MEFEWDEAKEAANRVKHGFGFERVHELDWVNAKPIKDQRFDYAESRFVIYSHIGTRLHACVFTLRKGRVRIISLRKANTREERKHGR